MTRRGLFSKETVKTARWAVAGNGRVVLPAVPGIVFRLQVSTFPADAAPFVGDWIPGASVNVVSEEEAPRALSVLDVGRGELYRARLAEHIARYSQDSVSSVSGYRK